MSCKLWPKANIQVDSELVRKCVCVCKVMNVSAVFRSIRHPTCYVSTKPCHWRECSRPMDLREFQSI